MSTTDDSKAYWHSQLTACGTPLKLLIAALLVAASIAVGATARPETAEAATGCYIFTRDCTNPTDSNWNCHQSAFTARTRRVVAADKVLTTELRYSAGCATGWSRKGSDSACQSYNWNNCFKFDVWAERRWPNTANTLGLTTYNGNKYSKQLQDTNSDWVRAVTRWKTGGGTILISPVTVYY